MGKIMKFVMTLLLVAHAVGQAWAAVTVYVPSAYTAKMTAAVPVDCSYGSWGYHSQMVYPQSLLEEANLPAEAFITAVKFFTRNYQYPLVPGEEQGTENNPLTI